MSKRKDDPDSKHKAKDAKSVGVKSQLDLVIKVKKLKPNITTLADLLLQSDLDENPLKQTHSNPFIDNAQKCNAFVSMLGSDIEEAALSPRRLQFAHELRISSGL